MTMRSGLALSLLSLSLAACVMVPVPSETYFPQGFGAAPATKRCAPARVSARVFERGSVALDVSLDEGPDFRGSLQLRGPAQFLASQMSVREYDFMTSFTTVDLNGCAPATAGAGVQECAFKTTIMAPEISVHFPAIEIDGVRRELPPVRFLKQSVRSMCVMTLEELGQQ